MAIRTKVCVSKTVIRRNGTTEATFVRHLISPVNRTGRFAATADQVLGFGKDFFAAVDSLIALFLSAIVERLALKALVEVEFVHPQIEHLLFVCGGRFIFERFDFELLRATQFEICT